MQRATHSFAALLVALAAFVGSATAQPQALGIAERKPVLGAACKVCPWGALADILKTAMRPYGYELQICYNCSQVNAPRIVGDRKMPPPLSSYPGFVPLQMMPAPPNAPVWGSSSNYATGSRNLSTSRVQYAAPKVSAPSLKS